MKLKLVHINHGAYYVRGLDNDMCHSYRDGDQWIAIMDSQDYKVWGDTPTQAVNKCLANYDLKLG